jgi:hypothetical protein
MNDFIIYALKSILALSLFALVYRIILINEGNFMIRRIYLLLSVNLALILPFFTFRFPFGGYNLPSVVLDEVVIYSNGIRMIRDSSSIPIGQVLKVLYFLIAGFLIFRILLNTITILIKANRSTPDQSEQIKFFHLNDKNISYSFFRNIFIGQTADDQELERILAHEKVHSLQLHSIDVMYIEFLAGLFWFNPLVWWFRKEIKNVHEYLADQGALETGFNRKEYQITILEHLIGSASLTITNNFNYSLIKNRIAMMNKEKNGRKNTWKVFLLLPVSIVVAFAFACTEKSSESADKINPEITVNKKSVFFKVDQMPEYPGGFDALRNYIAANLKYPEEAVKNKVAGKVFVQFIVDENGNIDTKTSNYQLDEETKKVSEIVGEGVVVGYKPAENSATENVDQYVNLLKIEAVRVVSSLPKFEKPGMQAGKTVAVVFTLPINFALQ